MGSRADSQEAWWGNQALLQQYVAEHWQLPPSDAALGSWCHTQRRAYRRRSRLLTAERVQALELVPGWWWVRPDAWDQKLALLQRYVAEHRRLPPRSIVYRGAKLGIWCDTQRSTYRGAGNCQPLTPERIQALELVPGWRWAINTWGQNLALLQQYVAAHRQLPVLRTVYQGAALGTWSYSQRRAYRGLTECRPLTAKQVQALEAVPGWAWH